MNVPHNRQLPTDTDSTSTPPQTITPKPSPPNTKHSIMIDSVCFTYHHHQQKAKTNNRFNIRTTNDNNNSLRFKHKKINNWDFVCKKKFENFSFTVRYHFIFFSSYTQTFYDDMTCHINHQYSKSIFFWQM